MPLNDLRNRMQELFNSENSWEREHVVDEIYKILNNIRAKSKASEKGHEVISIKAYVLDTMLPDGEYQGIHGGDVSIVKLQGYTYEIKTKICVRGINIPSTVVVDNGIAEVYLK